MTEHRICLWSGPRNISTAMMYSFGNRKDTHVIDEPLYPHFLLVTGAERPDREETLMAHETDAGKVVEEQFLGEHGSPILFLKHMPHHMIGVKDVSFVSYLKNVLLIRDPREMITSYIAHIEHPTMIDLGLELQWELFNELRESGNDPAVIDAQHVLSDPRSVLSQLCDHLGIPFDEDMLRWEAGPRTEDGVWAKYWYHTVHRSTGFKESRPKGIPVPDHLEELAQECESYYERLTPYSITP